MTEDTDWCTKLFTSVRVGGIWAVPRSGLIFRREADRLVCVGREPWEPRLGGDPTEWAEYQRDDFATIQRQFDQAGIVVAWQDEP